MSQISKKLNILILGGSGFIGSALIPTLLSRGHKVCATYCNHKPSHKANNLSWIYWDAIKKPLPKIDWNEINTVLHLANYYDLQNFPDNAKSIFRIVVESLFNLLDKSKEFGINRIITASTGHVLGNDKPANEENETYAPKNFYGTAKACAELLTTAYSDILSTAVLRYYYPYGPGGDRFLIGRLINKIKENKEILIDGEDGIIINPVHIFDLVRGTELALQSNASGIFHITGPELISLRSFLKLTGKFLGKKPTITSISKIVPKGHAGTCERSKEILKYKPSITPEEGIMKMINNKSLME